MAKDISNLRCPECGGKVFVATISPDGWVMCQDMGHWAGPIFECKQVADAPTGDAKDARIAELEAALYHIAHQKPVSSVHLDWHEEWRSLRTEAAAALASKGNGE